MADQQQTPYTNSPDSLKTKYVEALRIHVLEPLRRDLLEMQAPEQALRVLDAEFERAKNLRLSDYDVAAPVIGQAAEIAAR